MPQIRLVAASNIDTHWLEWLGLTQSFRYVPKENAPFTVRKEKSRRGDGDYWYGYKKVQGKLHKRYIGKAEDLTVNRLEEVAAQLIIPTSARMRPKVPGGSVTQNEEITRVLAENARLHNELQNSRSEGKNQAVQLEAVRSLQDKLQSELQKSLDEGKDLAVELEAVKSLQEKLHNELQNSRSEGKNLAVKLEAVSREREKLQIELHNRRQTQDLPPDYQVVRSSTLNKLKMGRQSASGKAIDAFIKELQKEKL